MNVHSNREIRRPMVSPYLERRLRSYREALREIRRRHAVRRARKAKDRAISPKSGHMRLIPTGVKRDNPRRPSEDL